MSTFRPRSAAEIADAAIQLVRRHYASLLPLAALLSIPSVLLGLVTARMQPIGMDAQDPTAAIRMLVPVALSGLWWAVSMGALVAVACAAYLGEPVDQGAAARLAFQRAGHLIGASVAKWALTFGAFVLGALALGVVGGIVGGIVAGGASLGNPNQTTIMAAVLAGVLVALVWPLLLFARYVVVTPIVMAENAGIAEALRRATTLSQGFLWRSVGLLVIALVILFATIFSAMGLLGLVIDNQQVTSQLAGLATVPLYPAWACLLAVLYYDLRIRKEGYDIELMARAMGDAPPGPSPPGAASGAMPEAAGGVAPASGAGH